jgi:hypothetical protein
MAGMNKGLIFGKKDIVLTLLLLSFFAFLSLPSILAFMPVALFILTLTYQSEAPPDRASVKRYLLSSRHLSRSPPFK